ncbi:hypothetical protein ES708_13116 [subsurface metagenome]
MIEDKRSLLSPKREVTGCFVSPDKVANVYWQPSNFLQNLCHHVACGAWLKRELPRSNLVSLQVSQVIGHLLVDGDRWPVSLMEDPLDDVIQCLPLAGSSL